MSELLSDTTFEPFRFYTCVNLSELTGLKAKNVEELLAHLKTVPGAVIYHHTHHFLKEHQYLNPEPRNDFAYWVSEILNEEELGERLESINTCEFETIRALREKIISVIETYLAKSKRKLNEARQGHELHFMKSVSFVLETPYEASTLEAFVDSMRKVTVSSIYFHMFEARLRLEKGVNDFSNWLENSLGEKELAKKIAKLDPYTYTMEQLRERIIRLIENRLPHKTVVAMKGN